MELKKIIGQRIRELRKARHFTQTELAAVPELGISQASLAAYETGAREPGMETVAALARFFRVSTDYLFGMVDETEPGAGLSDLALGYLATLNIEQQATVDAVLSSTIAPKFFHELMIYSVLSQLSDEATSRISSSEVPAQYLRPYFRDQLEEDLDVLSVCVFEKLAPIIDRETKNGKKKWAGASMSGSEKEGRT